MPEQTFNGTETAGQPDGGQIASPPTLTSGGDTSKTAGSTLAGQSPPETAQPLATPTPNTLRFAVIGDYGDHSQGEANTAAMVAGWEPDFIVTTGDNNYSLGEASTIDQNIGQYYHAFIHPYSGAYGAGASVNRFFPSLGNHDMNTDLAQPYQDYFTLPGNERYYDFVWGPVHFFMLNSDDREPDGIHSNSIQANWLAPRLAASTAPWQIVVFHHAPYSSSSLHGSTTYMQWPFAAWGADAVLAGHDHTYERLDVNGTPYFVNGLGGGSYYNFGDALPQSQVRFTGDPGAMLVEGDESQLTFQFFAAPDTLIDTFTLEKSPETAWRRLYLPLVAAR